VDASTPKLSLEAIDRHSARWERSGGACASEGVRQEEEAFGRQFNAVWFSLLRRSLFCASRRLLSSSLRSFANHTPPPAAAVARSLLVNSCVTSTHYSTLTLTLRHLYRLSILSVYRCLIIHNRWLFPTRLRASYSTVRVVALRVCALRPR